MTMTKRGIYHNLNETTYATSNGEVAFFFSSMFYLGKFLDEYKDHRKAFRKRIARAMKVSEMDTSLLADIHLYRDIEKRGFRTSVKGVEMEWQELHQYVLQNVTKKSTRDWYETPVQRLEGQKRTMV